MRYILDHDENPVTVSDEFAGDWFKENQINLFYETPVEWLGIKRTTVVTFFDNAIDTYHMRDGNIPLVWVTKQEGDDNKYGTRTATREEALVEHSKLVELKRHICKTMYPERRKNKVKRVVTTILNKIME
jgi:hypothetical protein